MIPHALQSLDRYTQSADARAARIESTPRNGERREHVVAAGESLWTISRAYDVDVRRLASWNAMAPGDVLSVGRALVIWTEAPAQIAAGATAEAALVRTDSAAGFAVNGRIREITYVVRRGDSLSGDRGSLPRHRRCCSSGTPVPAPSTCNPANDLLLVDVGAELMGFRRQARRHRRASRATARSRGESRRPCAAKAPSPRSIRATSRAAVEGMAAELGCDFTPPLDVAEDAQIDAFFTGLAHAGRLRHPRIWLRFALGDQLEGVSSTP
jgi:hypothetical protein